MEAKLHKSEVYFAGVPCTMADHLVSTLGVPKGSFPFRYLGVPRTTRKLSFNDGKPLIEITVGKNQELGS